LSQSTRLTDGQTDRETDGQTFSSLDRVCIPCSAVKIENVICPVIRIAIKLYGRLMAGYNFVDCCCCCCLILLPPVNAAWYCVRLHLSTCLSVMLCTAFEGFDLRISSFLVCRYIFRIFRS